MAKSASEILLPRTYKEIWKRGEEYVDRGRVELVKKETNDIKAKAFVYGKEKYAVVLKFTKNGIIKQCGCAYSLDGPPSRPACKHMAAAAIYWDEFRHIKRPSKKDIDLHTIAPAPISRQGIINLFKNPLKADLDKVRIVAEYASWRPQPHARLPNAPKINSDPRKGLKIIEVRKAFVEMEKWTKRSLYDPYFCAGEMSAAFCELLDVIKKRMDKSEPREVILIMALCVDWFYKRFSKLIDGIEGVWIFPPVRIGNIVSILLKRHSRNSAWKDFRAAVKLSGEKAGQKNLGAKAVADWAKERLKINH
jgi:hypothetical protein